MAEPSSTSAGGSPKQAKASVQPKQAKQPKTPAAAGAADAGGKQKSAKDIKKEKRAALVAARAAAEGGQGGESAGGGSASQRPGSSSGPSQQSAARGGPAAASTSAPKRPAAAAPAQTPDNHHLFVSHLPHARMPDTAAAFNTAKLHPTIVRLGVLMAEGTLRGANARTMAMMAAFQDVIRDYECHDQAVLWKDLPIYLSPMIAWLEGCRTKGVGGGNAIRWLKSEINKLGEREGDELTDAEVGQSLFAV